MAAAAVIVARAKLTGIVTVEFRRRPDGGLTLMKVDPRVVGMVGLCAALGFDVAALLYRLHTGQPVSVSPDYPAGLSWVWEKPYVWGLLKSRTRAWREVPAAFERFRRATTLAVWSAAESVPVHLERGRRRAQPGPQTVPAGAGAKRSAPLGGHADPPGQRVERRAPPLIGHPRERTMSVRYWWFGVFYFNWYGHHVAPGPR